MLSIIPGEQGLELLEEVVWMIPREVCGGVFVVGPGIGEGAEHAEKAMPSAIQ